MKKITFEQITVRFRELKDRIPKYPVYGVMRRGIIPATMYAIDNGLQIECLNLMKSKPSGDKMVVIDDVLAHGRTLSIVRGLWPSAFFITVVVDSHAEVKPDLWLFSESEWVVFPWEDEEKVTAGDRGFFRDDTAVYGRKNA